MTFLDDIMLDNLKNGCAIYRVYSRLTYDLLTNLQVCISNLVCTASSDEFTMREIAGNLACIF